MACTSTAPSDRSNQTTQNQEPCIIGTLDYNISSYIFCFLNTFREFFNASCVSKEWRRCIGNIPVSDELFFRDIKDLESYSRSIFNPSILSFLTQKPRIVAIDSTKGPYQRRKLLLNRVLPYREYQDARVLEGKKIDAHRFYCTVSKDSYIIYNNEGNMLTTIPLDSGDPVEYTLVDKNFIVITARGFIYNFCDWSLIERFNLIEFEEFQNIDSSQNKIVEVQSAGTNYWSTDASFVLNIKYSIQMLQRTTYYNTNMLLESDKSLKMVQREVSATCEKLYDPYHKNDKREHYYEFKKYLITLKDRILFLDKTTGQVAACLEFGPISHHLFDDIISLNDNDFILYVSKGDTAPIIRISFSEDQKDPTITSYSLIEKEKSENTNFHEWETVGSKSTQELEFELIEPHKKKTRVERRPSEVKFLSAAAHKSLWAIDGQPYLYDINHQKLTPLKPAINPINHRLILTPNRLFAKRHNGSCLGVFEWSELDQAHAPLCSHIFGPDSTLFDLPSDKTKKIANAIFHLHTSKEELCEFKILTENFIIVSLKNREKDLYSLYSISLNNGKLIELLDDPLDKLLTNLDSYNFFSWKHYVGFTETIDEEKIIHLVNLHTNAKTTFTEEDFPGNVVIEHCGLVPKGENEALVVRLQFDDLEKNEKGSTFVEILSDPIEIRGIQPLIIT